MRRGAGSGLLPYGLLTTLTRTATEAAAPAVLLAAAGTGRSAADGALLVGAMGASAIVTGPLVGLRLDRSARPMQVVAVAMVVMGLAFLALRLSIGGSLAVLLLIAAVGGLGQPALTGGWTAQLPSLVAAERLRAGYSVDAATYSVGAMVGPALTASAIVVAPEMPLLVVPLLLAVPLVLLPMLAAPVRRQQKTVRATLRDGVRAMTGIPPLRANVVLTTLAIAGQASFVVCAPTLAVQRAGSLTYAGTFLSVMAVGGLAGSLLVSRWQVRRPGRLTMYLVAVVAVSMAVIALVHDPVTTLVAAAVAGGADGVLTAAIFLVRDRDAPAAVRGQVFTIGASLRGTSFALAAAAYAPLAAHPGPAFAVGAGVEVCALVLGVLSHRGGLPRLR